MKRLLLLLFIATTAVKLLVASEPADNGYMPMFEEGKEWRYTIHDRRTYTDVWLDDMQRIYRVDGTTEIDGKTYFVVNTYTDGAQEPDSGVPFGYFREEIAEKAVYFLFNEFYKADPVHNPGENWMSSEEIKLYDFSTPEESEIARSFYGRPICETSFTGNAMEHRGYSIDDDHYGFFEGLGFIYRDKAPDKPFRMGAYDLTGPFVYTTDGMIIFPYLYSIVAADGTELYSMDINRPDGVEAVKCDGDDEAPVYYNLQGIRVDNPAKGEVVIRCTVSKAEKIIF